jgi:hypothetical protein
MARFFLLMLEVLTRLTILGIGLVKMNGRATQSSLLVTPLYILLQFFSDTSKGLNVYSSKDLTNWKFEGLALSPVEGTVIGPETVVERPKVVFSKPLNQWIVRAKLFSSRYFQVSNSYPNDSYGSTRTTTNISSYDKASP